MEQLKAKFKEKCTWKSHGHVPRMLANFDLDDPNVFSFLLGRGCLKCINLFLAEKKFPDGILLYIVRQPEIPLSVVEGFLEGHLELFTNDVELPVQELTNSNRLDLLKLFRQMKGAETSIEPPAKKVRLDMYTRTDFLEAFSRHDFEMIRVILKAEYDCYGCTFFWDSIIEELSRSAIVKICKKEAGSWPKDIIMLLLNRMHADKSSELLQMAVNHDNDHVLQAVVEKFPLVSNARIKFQFRKVKQSTDWSVVRYNIEETLEKTYGTVLHYLAKNRKFDLLEEILVACEQSGAVLDFLTLNSIRDALSAGAPLKTIKAFLKGQPDLIQVLNTKKNIFLLHLAMDGEQPEVLRFLIEENRLDPQKRNAEGLDLILYKISGLRHFCRYLNPIPIAPIVEMLEYLFPLIYSTGSINNRNFGDLFAVYTFSTLLERRNLFNACTETFYGPRVNSKYALLKKILEEFDLLSMWTETFDQGQMISIFLHDPWYFPLKNHPFYPKGSIGEKETVESELRKMHKKAFDSDGKLEAFIPLVKHLETIGFFDGRRYPREGFGFLENYLPIEPTLEIVSRIYRVFTKLRGEIHFDLTKILKAAFRSSEICKKFIKYGLVRALYSHYPISSKEWHLITEYDYIYCDQNKVQYREIYSQLDELMPVDCLLKHKASEESLSLKHFCRLKIREVLEKKAAGDSIEFFHSIDALERIPPKMKKYLHFAENFVDN